MSENYLKKADAEVLLNVIKVIISRQRLDKVDWLSRQQVERVRRYVTEVMEKSPDPVEVENVLGLLLDDKDKSTPADKADRPNPKEIEDSGDKK